VKRDAWIDRSPRTELLTTPVAENGTHAHERLGLILKRYSQALEYEYRVKTAALGTLKQYSIFSLTLYLE
jgi:hypothetical protein